MLKKNIRKQDKIAQANIVVPLWDERAHLATFSEDNDVTWPQSSETNWQKVNPVSPWQQPLLD